MPKLYKQVTTKKKYTKNSKHNSQNSFTSNFRVMCYVSTLHDADVLLFLLLYSATRQPPNILHPRSRDFMRN